MGERVTRVVVGACIKDMPPCPHEDGWGEWIYIHAGLDTHEYHRSVGKVKLRSSYESEPGWLGFEIATLEYGETHRYNEEGLKAYEAAVDAWERLTRTVGEKLGVEIGPGEVIVAMDQ